MKVSILKQGNYLIVHVQYVLTNDDLMLMHDRLIHQVGENRSSGVILDVSGLDMLDSFSSSLLRELAQILRLRGARTVIVGIQPDVAFSMVQLGMVRKLIGVATALDLEDGLAFLDLTKGNRRPSSW